MKLALLFSIISLHVSARGFSQTVSFSGKDVPLQAVFASFEKQTGCSFFFNYALLKDARPVTLEIRNATLEEALNQTLKDVNLDYYRQGKTIFIVKKPDTVIRSSGPGSPVDKQVDVKGRVTNQLGESMISANVVVKNGNRGTVTNEKGEFELKSVSIGSILEISYLGYERKRVEVTGDAMITVLLVQATSQLDVAQVIAYGQTTQRLSTGNITMVKGEDIAKQPVSNPLLALEGRVPGLYITQTNGIAGGGATVRIQGQNSISYGNDPLYVIDGVPYISQMIDPNFGTQLGKSGGIAGSGYGNPMNYINPADIQSVEVLKDADATAIYGSRAANGAILVTTKKGKAGKSLVDLNFQDGWGAVTRKMPLLNTRQYLEMRHEAYTNDGLPFPSIVTNPNDGNSDINGSWDTTRYTDWQKALVGGTAHFSTASVSISGGNLTTQYFVGGTYHRETPVFPGSYNDAKASLHFSLSTVSNNQRLKTQLTASYLFDNNRLPNIDMTVNALTIPPDAPPVYKPDGTINWQLLGSGAYTFQNPFASIKYNPYQCKTYNLISNGTLSYQVLPGLFIKSNFGYTNLQSNQLIKSYLSSFDPGTQQSQGINARNAQYTYTLVNSWIIEPQIEYKKLLGEGQLEGLIGSTVMQTNSSDIALLGSGYNSDATLGDIHSAATLSTYPSVYTTYKYGAAFGRLNYNWGDKYIIDLVARRDGSSRFGSANEYHDFGSAGVAWIFSQERFIKEKWLFLSQGKLRGSFGTTGNDQIGDYKFMNLYTTPITQVPYQGTTGLNVNSLPNPHIQWEATKKLQAAIELGFIQNRILLSVNYIYNRSSNQLASVPLPIITGFSFIQANFPATVINTAEEVSLNTINIRKRSFEWSSSVNLTIPKNTLTNYRFPTFNGRPLGTLSLFVSKGVDPSTGVYVFSDSHGSVTSNPSAATDQTLFISTTFPKFFGGFENSFRYKQIRLDFLFQFVKRLGANYVMGPQVPGRYGNQPIYVLNRWQKPGDLTSTQRYSSNSSISSPWSDEVSSNTAYSDAGFIRLKNLSLSYALSDNALRRLHLQQLRIFILGQNLLTLTSFKGLDPETGNSVLPPLKMLTVGLQVQL